MENTRPRPPAFWHLSNSSASPTRKKPKNLDFYKPKKYIPFLLLEQRPNPTFPKNIGLQKTEAKKSMKRKNKKPTAFLAKRLLSIASCLFTKSTFSSPILTACEAHGSWVNLRLALETTTRMTFSVFLSVLEILNVIMSCLPLYPLSCCLV